MGTIAALRMVPAIRVRLSTMRMVPVLLTQSIVMLQDTSLVYVVGLRDFLTSADIVASRDNRPTELYMFVAIVFLVICFSASRLANQLRRRYSL
jgi:glutamate/aspartate transport system permease protein